MQEKTFRAFLRFAVSQRLGGLCQAALRRPRAGAPIPGPLHPPRRHLQPSDCRFHRRQGLFPLEGLRPWQQTTADDAHRGGVPTALPAAHAAAMGFIRIRFFGFLASRRRAALLPICQKLAEIIPRSRSPTSPAPAHAVLWVCPRCGGPMVVIARLTAHQIQEESESQRAPF